MVPSSLSIHFTNTHSIFLLGEKLSDIEKYDKKSLDELDTLLRYNKRELDYIAKEIDLIKHSIVSKKKDVERMVDQMDENMAAQTKEFNDSREVSGGQKQHEEIPEQLTPEWVDNMVLKTLALIRPGFPYVSFSELSEEIKKQILSVMIAKALEHSIKINVDVKQ